MLCNPDITATLLVIDYSTTGFNLPADVFYFLADDMIKGGIAYELPNSSYLSKRPRYESSLR